MDKQAFFWKIMAGELPHPPAGKTLGIAFRHIDAEAGTIEVEFQGRPEFTNPAGNIQGGFLAAMLDDTMGPALAATLKQGEFAPNPPEFAPLRGVASLPAQARGNWLLGPPTWVPDRAPGRARRARQQPPRFTTMHTRCTLTLLLLVLLSTGRSAAAEDMTIDAPDGRRISAVADFPSGPGPHAAMVLAPGQGYHMHLPALAETARALVEQGVAVFRFNWTYFTAQPQGRPSADLSKELDDFQAVVAAARAHPKVDAAALSVGGKSLGSLVAWRALRADPQLRSALLLTPVCSRVAKGETTARPEAKQNYPGFETEKRPVLFLTGENDPLCSPAVLYSFAATSPGRARVAIIGGDHGYESPTLPLPAAEIARKRNLAAVSALAAGFAAEVSASQR